MEFITHLINGLISGLSSGATYAIIALGYTMVYGIAKMLNFAHGDVIMVGCYAMHVTLLLTGHPIPAILIAILCCTILGISIEKFAYKPLRGASPLSVLITAIGVSYLLQSLAQIIFGEGQKMPQKLLISEKLQIGAISINYNTILTLIVSVVIMVILTLFVKYTKVGRAMNAVSEDRDAARLMGINTNAIITITFAIGSALAAVAGYLMLCKAPSVTVTLGAMPGIVEGIAASFPAITPFTTAIEFSILIVVLLVKPSGILGKLRREKV